MQSIHQFVSALFHNTCCIDPSDPIQQSGHIRIKGIHLFLCHVGVLPYRIHRNKISRCSSGRPLGRSLICKGRILIVIPGIIYSHTNNDLCSLSNNIIKSWYGICLKPGISFTVGKIPARHGSPRLSEFVK